MELLKSDLVNVNWVSELDALASVIGLSDVNCGRTDYYSMRNDRFDLYVAKGKVLGEKCIRVKYTVYEDFEEKKFRVSPELFDRFVTALKKFAQDTEKDRFLKRYRWEVMRRNDYTDDESDKKPAGDMVEH